jgi:hypothetical protein
MLDIHQRPFFIRVFVPTGDPDGLRIVEKSNWPGVGVVFNRTNYKEVVGRSELDVLVGRPREASYPRSMSVKAIRSKAGKKKGG